MRVLTTPAYVAMIESITQARKTRASLFTYLKKREPMSVCVCVCVHIVAF